MSCNITSGIAKGCNDQIGGIAGVHYTERVPGVIPTLDSNGVVIDYQNTAYWYWVDAENQQGNLTETYEFGSGASVLGFNQNLSFFIPDTAVPGTTGGTSHTVNNFAGMIAQQNNMAMIVETKHATITRGPWPKTYLFGHERGAYCNGGNKQSGINYTDNNGYTIEIAANSKEPMLEASYMVAHLPVRTYTNGYSLLGSRWNSGATTPTSWTVWDYTPLKRFIGGNVHYLIPPVPAPDIYVQEGDNCSFKTFVTADWNANAFDANGDFRVKAFTTFTSQGTVVTLPGTVTQAPIAPGVQTIGVEYTNYGPGFPYGGQGGEILWNPLVLAIDDPAVADQYIFFSDGSGVQGDVKSDIQIMAVTQ